jgi:diaminopimelate decarboxylase
MVSGPPPAAAAPVLPALWDPALRGFVEVHGSLIRELAHGFGGPLHLVFPQQFAARLQAFRQVLDGHHLAGGIFYAKKANKARCFARACAQLGAGIDVASAGEFVEALAAGVPGDAIGVSGPAKALELLQLALAHGALVAIDSFDELEAVTALARQQGRAARILLRMLPASQPHSRFGLDPVGLDAAVAACERAIGHIILQGFAFHLSGYCAAARCDQAGLAVRACLAARARGLTPDTLNIGGGFAVSYVSQAHWQAFQAAQTPDDYHARKQFGGCYPYYQSRAAAAMLEAILCGTPAGENLALKTLLGQHGLRLMLEPGRALLDQAGFTVFTVQGVQERRAAACGHAAREPRRDYAIITVNGTSFSLSEQWFDSEFLPDPELLDARPNRAGAAADGAAPYRACIGGASCLDSDMLTWRKVAFPRRPRAGDLLLYPNTAGYQMDSNESPFHELPLPPKVAVTLGAAGPRWRLDRPAPL